jgi:hypothetical protein
MNPNKLFLNLNQVRIVIKNNSSVIYRRGVVEQHLVLKYHTRTYSMEDTQQSENSNEGINSYLKDHLEVETHVNGKGLKNIDLHVTKCCITLLAVALTRMQKGIKENLSSVAYLT